MSELEAREAMEGIRRGLHEKKEVLESYRKANLGALSIIGGNPYADVLGAWQDARGVAVKTFKKERESCEEAMRWYESLKFSISANSYSGVQGPSVDVRGAALMPKTDKKEPYCPRPESKYEEEPEIRGNIHYYSGLKKLDEAVSYYSNTLKRQDSDDIRMVNEYLNDFRKDREAMASMLGGGIAARAAGIQPVFVTNWPDDRLQKVASAVEIAVGAKYLLSLLRSLLPRLGARFGAAAIPDAAAAAGGRLAASEMAAGAGLALGAPEIALIAGASIVGWHIQTEVYPEIGKSLIERLTGIGRTERNAESGKGGGLFGIFDEMFGGVKDFLSLNNAYAYGTDELNSIGNYHSDSMRGLTEAAEGAFVASRPREGNCKCPAPEKIENKVNLVIHVYDDGRTYVETDMNTEPKIDVRRGYMD